VEESDHSIRVRSLGDLFTRSERSNPFHSRSRIPPIGDSTRINERQLITTSPIPQARPQFRIKGRARARVIKSNQEDFARANDARPRALSRYNASKPDVDNSGVDIMTVCLKQ